MFIDYLPSHSTRQVATAIILGLLIVLTSCNGGVRPTLVNDQRSIEPLPQVEVPAAPAGTQPFPAAAPDFALQATVEDALLAWADDRDIPYTDSCSLVTPSGRELCDVSSCDRVTGFETTCDRVRLLGPDPTTTWYVVTVAAEAVEPFGTGYRVADVQIAGR